MHHPGYCSICQWVQYHRQLAAGPDLHLATIAKEKLQNNAKAECPAGCSAGTHGDICPACGDEMLYNLDDPTEETNA